MSDLRNFWFHPQSPRSYHDVMNKIPSGIVDEEIVADFINSYLPNKRKVVVDLGIGSGRELVWLDKTLGVGEIIGVDYSPAMVKFCKKEAKGCKHELKLIRDDLLSLSLLPRTVEGEGKPVIYISLINTFGNFSIEERLVALRNITSILKLEDRIVLALYNRCHQARFAKSLSPYLQTDHKIDEMILAEVIEYGFYPFLWVPVLDKYHQMPRLWYDKKGHDFIMHIDGKRLLASHRFSKKEIEGEFKEAGLKVDRIIEGKAMYIAVGKKLV